MVLDDVVGHRVYNHEIGEACTIIGVDEIGADAIMALLQYDDGVFWDEQIGAEGIAEQFGWAEDGLLAEQYELLGPGPTLHEACEDHDWFPQTDDVWDSYEAMDPNLYGRFVRCKKCGLSGATAGDYGAGTHHPTMCAVCDEGAAFDDVSYTTESYYDRPVCGECRMVLADEE